MAVMEVRRVKNVLLGVTGSVAAIKVKELVQLLRKARRQGDFGDVYFEVKVVATASARHFLTGEHALDDEEEVLCDEQEWATWKQKGDPVMHIKLREWADILVIAPLSANSLAKLAGGICDNLLLCIARAWQFKEGKPVIVAPAMNTAMWESAFTGRHLDVLRSLGKVKVMAPVEKELACGEVGAGAMADVCDIANEAIWALGF